MNQTKFNQRKVKKDRGTTVKEKKKKRQIVFELLLIFLKSVMNLPMNLEGIRLYPTSSNCF